MHPQIQRVTRALIVGSGKHPDFDQVVHRDIGFGATLVDDHFTGGHVECDLPLAGCDVLGGDPSGFEVPVRVRFEEVRQQVSQRLRCDRLKLAIEVDRRRQRRFSRAVPFDQAP